MFPCSECFVPQRPEVQSLNTQQSEGLENHFQQQLSLLRSDFESQMTGTSEKLQSALGQLQDQTLKGNEGITTTLGWTYRNSWAFRTWRISQHWISNIFLRERNTMLWPILVFQQRKTIENRIVPGLSAWRTNWNPLQIRSPMMSPTCSSKMRRTMWLWWEQSLEPSQGLVLVASCDSWIRVSCGCLLNIALFNHEQATTCMISDSHI